MRKTIALVAHDNKKADLVEWVEHNATTIVQHNLVCTGTTGKLIEKTLKDLLGDEADLNITKYKSGPLGGDQQLGALVAEEKIDIMIFFWDPMLPQPHEVDVKALLRIGVLYNTPTACNRATADFLITSPLFQGDYQPSVKDFSKYLKRKISL